MHLEAKLQSLLLRPRQSPCPLLLALALCLALHPHARPTPTTKSAHALLAPTSHTLAHSTPVLAVGQSSSTVKVTPQDRSILECVTCPPPVASRADRLGALRPLHSLKLQRDKLKQYQRRVRPALPPPLGPLDLSSLAHLGSDNPFAQSRTRCTDPSVFVRPPQIEVVLAREREIAAESLRQGNKQRALIALRQKKYQETLLSQTDSQLETLQKLVRRPTGRSSCSRIGLRCWQLPAPRCPHAN